jgi:hypothetical protein
MIMDDNEKLYYAGVDMTDWDFSNIDDPNIIRKAFVAVCNFAEELSGCAGCPLRDKVCFSKNGEKFWDRVNNWYYQGFFDKKPIENLDV